MSATSAAVGRSLAALERLDVSPAHSDLLDDYSSCLPRGDPAVRGRVLIAGSCAGSSDSIVNPLSSAELYQPWDCMDLPDATCR